MSRFDYVRYDEQAQRQQDAAKVAVQQLENIVFNIGEGRAASLALTKLEECYMWIGKLIRDHQISRNGSAELMEERKDG